jgi:integrase/recombinase XerD
VSDFAPYKDLYLGHLAVERALSPNTVAAYASDLDDFLLHLKERGVKSPLAAGRGDLLDYLLHIADRLGPRSRARRLSAVKGFYAFLEEENYVKGSPAASLESPALPRSVPKALGEEDVQRLVAAPDPSTPLGLRNRAMFELMYAGGLRVSELLDLSLGGLNLDEGFIRARGKGSKDRLIPVGDLAAFFVRRYLQEARPGLARGRERPWVFLNSRGGRMSRQYFWRLVSREAQALGLGRVSPHCLRHSFATHLVEGGADLRAVQLMLGHRGLGTTEKYLKTGSRRLKKVHEKSHPRGRREDK